MDFGINLATAADSWKVVKRAEELGYTRAWFYDTQMLMFLRPEEHEVCTADLIRTVTFTETRAALRDRIRELGAAGYNHFSIHIRHGHSQMLEEWADVFEGV